jgi:hypothetical protein
MPYTVKVSRSTPSAFLFLLDQSASMSGEFGGGSGGATKAAAATDALNRILQELVLRCVKEDGIRDYFYVGVVGYGNGVVNALGHVPGSGWLSPISAIGEHPKRIDVRSRKVSDGAGGLVEETVEFPVWVDIDDNGRSTPMCAALDHARQVLESWVEDYPNGFPPIVLNITDGEATDGDPAAFAPPLRKLSTTDGDVLLYNCHLSSTRGPRQAYPSDDEGLTDRYARQLFGMSSELPPIHFEGAIHFGHGAVPGARGFVFNSDMVELVEFIDIGTTLVAETAR